MGNNSYNSFDWRSYIKNYPDLKEAGINDCEKAWGHYQKFGKHEGRVYDKIIDTQTYTTFYKNCSDTILDFSQTIDVNINGNMVKMYSSTPCISKYLDNYILNVRYVNYILKEYDPCYTYSVNKCLIMDSSFNIISSFFHEYNFTQDLIKHKGLEDIKLFNDNGTFYYIGNIFKHKKSYITSEIIELNKEENSLYQFKFKENKLHTTFNENKNWEKNWCFVKYNEKVCLVYDWYPIKVCNIDYNTNSVSILKEIKSPNLFENIRGSTNGCQFGDEIWFIAHVNKKGDYFHLFIVFDLDMNLKRYSDFFKFENKEIEFCLGLIMEESKIIISYSTNDNTSKLMVIKNLKLKFHII